MLKISSLDNNCIKIKFPFKIFPFILFIIIPIVGLYLLREILNIQYYLIFAFIVIINMLILILILRVKIIIDPNTRTVTYYSISKKSFDLDDITGLTPDTVSDGEGGDSHYLVIDFESRRKIKISTNTYAQAEELENVFIEYLDEKIIDNLLDRETYDKRKKIERKKMKFIAFIMCAIVFLFIGIFLFYNTNYKDISKDDIIEIEVLFKEIKVKTIQGEGTDDYSYSIYSNDDSRIYIISEIIWEDFNYNYFMLNVNPNDTIKLKVLDYEYENEEKITVFSVKKNGTTYLEFERAYRQIKSNDNVSFFVAIIFIITGVVFFGLFIISFIQYRKISKELAPYNF